MEQPAILHDGARKGCSQMQPRVELASRPYEDVGGHSSSPECLIRESALSSVRRMRVGYDHHEIVITVGMVFVASMRTEEVDTIGLERLHEATYDFL